jgi:hypothetical protein
MWQAFKDFWKAAAEEGMKFPFLHDPVTKKPSITLFFPYATFTLAFTSTILLHIWPTLILATITSIIFWIVSVVFYQIRKLHKAKFDLDDKSFELNSGGD